MARWLVRFGPGSVRLLAVVLVAGVLVVAERPNASRAVGPAFESETALYGVAGTSSANAWAVGTTRGARTLIERWNGTAWKAEKSPNPGHTSSGAAYLNELFGVAATSASNAWAVGDYYTGRDVRGTLIEHWNGRAWKVQRSPNASRQSNFLHGVAVTSASNAWAVGDYTRRGAFRTLILHWNGSAWKVQKSPNADARDNHLYGVAATSRSNAWAVGSYSSAGRTRSGAIIEHWNGSAWKLEKTIPSVQGYVNVLYGIAATSPSDAWAVGSFEADPQFPSSLSRTLVEHWNGTAWEEQESPNAGADHNYLYGVAASSPDDAWAVGYCVCNQKLQTLIEHWDGTEWLVQKSANPGTDENVLEGVAAASSANAWAVGRAAYRRKTRVSRALVEHWNGAAWR